jgi:hypothetical protein
LISADAPNARIVATVIATYGCDTWSPSISTLSAPSAHGAESMSPERNWLDTSPGSRTDPPRRPSASTVTGR